MEAVQEFLKENRDFERDASREKFLLTFHPGGYLKRIR
jgi:cephalosporin hydroxylase